jgi:hypothetical protein
MIGKNRILSIFHNSLAAPLEAVYLRVIQGSPVVIGNKLYGER